VGAPRREQHVDARVRVHGHDVHGGGDVRVLRVRGPREGARALSAERRRRRRTGRIKRRRLVVVAWEAARA
jgi:hypothetical protein